MKVFISYTVGTEDEFILTILSSRLREKSFTINTSQNFYIEDLDLNTMGEIKESNLFMAIVLNSGHEKNRVFEEWNYAVSENVPNLLLIEEASAKGLTLKGNYIKFDRSSIHLAISEISRRMASDNATSDKADDILPWIIGGESIISSLALGFPEIETSQSKNILSGRLKLIEQQLLSIDASSFQSLCDVYLCMREQRLSSINRIGSQFGKQKTTKGTPDTFFRLDDGSLRYVEYTTQATDLVEKIKADIDKCLNIADTDFPLNRFNKIIICFNSRINVAQEMTITKYANEKYIQLELIGLDWLALEIYSKYLLLAKDMLGIPLDTGQLLPLSNFVEEYSNKAGKLATPLDNIFLHREKELSEIGHLLESSEITIISGFPGVGKTKIALQALDIFLTSHKDYTALAVSKKDQDISEDLKIHLQQKANYILLVDDANRQLLNFKQILGVFREKRKGNIKLLITVRDYAMNDVLNECFEFEPQKIILKKFTDEEIVALIKSDSFEIRNSKYQKKIIEIADGNARLAIMAAKVAKQEQEFFLLGDTSDLYDSYFQTFIKDFGIFSNKNVLKTLGIISFFYTVDRSKKDFIENLLLKFEIDYHDFNESIDELEKRELIEVQFNHARVSEQVMSTYFFYKVFIKDELLSFKTLLFNYFPTWQKRFSDTIIPSNNSFGYENVLKKISAILDEYLREIYQNEKRVFEFLSIFWFYKREETLNYFHPKIQQLPEPINPDYSLQKEENKFDWHKDKTLVLLSNLFDFFTESFVPALELSFEYCRKNPQILTELVKTIKEKIRFEDDDYNVNFQRQVALFELLVAKLKEKEPHYITAFFALTATFLSHQYRVVKGGRKHSISFYNYPLRFTEVIRDFRKRLWTTLFESYQQYPNNVLSILKDYNPGYPEAIVEILEFDLSLLIPFIEQNLKPTFKNIHFVHELIDRLDREDLKSRDYQKLKRHFKSADYVYFKKLDWDSIRGRKEYQLKKTDDFYKLKEQDIRTALVFSSKDDFVELHRAIENINSIEKSAWGLYESLNIIAEENFIRNEVIGFQLLESILQNYPKGIHPLHKSINVIASKSEDWALKLWHLLKAWGHREKIYWQLSFFDYLPKEFANDYYKSELIETIELIDVEACHLQFESYEKFLPIDPKILVTILEIAVNKIESQKFRISLSFHFFEKFSNLLVTSHALLEKAYIQQEKMFNQNFDFNLEGLKSLVKVNPSFFIQYIKLFYTGVENSSHQGLHDQFSFVWDLENSMEIVEEATNLIIDEGVHFGISEHPLMILFNLLNDEQQKKAKNFILDYIKQNNRNHERINPIFDVLRHTMREFFEIAFLHYLSLNSNITDFQNIHWRGTGGLFSGDVIIGDVHAAEWQNILNIVEKSANQLDLIPIKAYIKNLIKYELRNGEEEKKRKFINPSGF